METGEILARLRQCGSMPVEAVRAAAASRETAVPALIAEIERCAAREDLDDEAATFVFSAFHLLGSLRAAEASATLARLLRLPEERLSWLLGDAVTETAPQVMAAVFDGDPAPLHAVIEDPDAYEFVRSGMCDALSILVLEGRLAREEAAAFFRGVFERLQPRACNFVWEGWQGAVAVLGLVDQVPRVREVFRRGWIDRTWMRFRDFEEDLALWRNGRAGVDERLRARFTPFGDFVEEMADWPLYRPAEADTDAETGGTTTGSDEWAADGNGDPLPDWATPGTPAYNPWRHVSRNDPCPCGSGKKFKRCCMP